MAPVQSSAAGEPPRRPTDADLLDTPQAGPKALRGSALRVGAFVLGILLSLVSAPLLVRHLGEVTYGRYIVVVALVGIVGGLTEGGVNTVALREYASCPALERERLMANLLGVRMGLSVAGIAAAVAFAALAGYGRDMVLGTLLAGIGMGLQVTQDLLDVSLQATLRFGWVSLAEFLRQFIGVALIVALVVGGAHLLGFFVITIPAGGIALLFSMRLVRGLFPLRPEFHFGTVARLLRKTVSYAIAVAMNTIYFRITVVIVSLAASAAQIGYFGVSFRVVEVLIVLPGLVMAAAFPILIRAQRDDDERFAHAARRMFELAVLVGAWLVLALELGSGFAVAVLTGHGEADPAAAVLRVQGVAVMFTFVAVACTYPLLSLGHIRALLLANALGLVAAVLLSLLLVPVLAARGAAVATVGAELTLATVSAIALIRARPGLGLPFGVVGVAAVAAGAGAGAGYLVGVDPVVEVVVGSCVYVAGITLLGRFPPELRDAVRGLRGTPSARVTPP
jgi:O-antigen/teichoic acid export membrane protein